MLARARGVPMVVGLGAIALDGHDEAIVDGEARRVVLEPRCAERGPFGRSAQRARRSRREKRDFLDQPAVTADGTPIEVLVNVAGLDELDALDPANCDGIGLMRTEFLFRDGAPLAR